MELSCCFTMKELRHEVVTLIRLRITSILATQLWTWNQELQYLWLISYSRGKISHALLRRLYINDTTTEIANLKKITCGVLLRWFLFNYNICGSFHTREKYPTCYWGEFKWPESKLMIWQKKRVKKKNFWCMCYVGFFSTLFWKVR